jgi:DNA mismatch repair protein MutL
VGAIERLSSHVIDQIAAGEVIERPASVLKELLENALDAGARFVEIELDKGGSTRLQVNDDGCGMDKEDARLCLERHATSKLKHADDLAHIHTLGFRGEALSSITAISRLCLVTRRPVDREGWKIVMEGGHLISEGPVGCPVGTSLEVCDLFFNTPARQKFLRSPATEQSHCLDTAVRVILGTQRTGLQVRSGGRTLVHIPSGLNTKGGPDAAERVLCALGSKVDRVFWFAHHLDDIEVTGFISDPAKNRRDTKGMWCLINGRYVRDRLMHRTIRDAYQPFLERGRYPVCLVHLHLDPEAMDVNVHPQKLEVRFGSSASVYRAVGAALSIALQQGGWQKRSQVIAPPHAGGDVSSILEANASQSSDISAWRLNERYSTPANTWSNEDMAGDPTEASTFALTKGLLWEAFPFALVRLDSSLYLIDIPGACGYRTEHGLQNAWNEGKVKTRPLMFPASLSLPSTGTNHLANQPECLADVGFILDTVGPGQYVLRAVPEALPHGLEWSTLISDLLADHMEAQKATAGLAIEVIVERCTQAVKRCRSLEIKNWTSFLQEALNENSEQSSSWWRQLDANSFARLWR